MVHDTNLYIYIFSLLNNFIFLLSFIPEHVREREGRKRNELFIKLPFNFLHGKVNISVHRCNNNNRHHHLFLFLLLLLLLLLQFSTPVVYAFNKFKKYNFKQGRKIKQDPARERERKKKRRKWKYRLDLCRKDIVGDPSAFPLYSFEYLAGFVAMTARLYLRVCW